MKLSLHFFWNINKIQALVLLGVCLADMVFRFFILWIAAFGIVMWVMASAILVCRSHLNLALSMGVSRRNYFLGLQCTALCYAVIIAGMDRWGGHLINLPLWLAIFCCQFVYILFVWAGTMPNGKRGPGVGIAHVIIFSLVLRGLSAGIGEDNLDALARSPMTAGLLVVLFVVMQGCIWRCIKKYTVT